MHEASYLKNNFYSSHSTPNGFQMNYILKKDKQTIKKGNKYIQETYGVSNDKVSMKCRLLNDIYTLQIKYTYKASKKFLADEIKAIKKKYPK